MNVRSGFWDENGVGYSMISGIMPRINNIRRVVNRDGFRVATELFDSLIGAGTGGTAAATHARVGNTDSNTDGNNEDRIVTVTDINRATAAADVTFLKSFTFGVRARPAYPADKSGNGGGVLA